MAKRKPPESSVMGNPITPKPKAVSKAKAPKGKTPLDAMIEAGDKLATADPFVPNEYGVIPPQTGETGLTIKGVPLVFVPGEAETMQDAISSAQTRKPTTAWTGNGAPIDDDTGKPLDFDELADRVSSANPKTKTETQDTKRTQDATESPLQDATENEKNRGNRFQQATEPTAQENHGLDEGTEQAPQSTNAASSKNRGDEPFPQPTIKGVPLIWKPNSREDAGLTPLSTTAEQSKNTGDVPIEPASADSNPGPELLESVPRARLPSEKRHAYWERMRKAARLAGLPRGQGPGSAYVWATEQAEREFPYVVPEIVEELPAAEVDVAPVLSPIGDKVVPEAIAAPVQTDGSVSGLSNFPPDWPKLPANAQLQAEIAWVTANRLLVRDGTGVNLSRAMSPPPSYSALSWLETSILFPAKFADISVKATAETDDEREFIKRERFAIEEIRGILKEMLDAKG